MAGSTAHARSMCKHYLVSSFCRQVPYNFMGYRRRSRGGLGMRPSPQKFGCGVFYGSDSHENFTEINSNPRQKRLCKPIKHSGSPCCRGSIAPDPIPALPQTLSCRGGDIPPPLRTHFCPPFQLRSSAFGPRHFQSMDPTML